MNDEIDEITGIRKECRRKEVHKGTQGIKIKGLWD
jgi:hypothetical protein